MGQKQSKRSDTKTPMSAAPPQKNDGNVYLLKKRRPGCTGMFWRSDPTGTTKLASNKDWPRDGAKLKGTVVTSKGEQWLLCTEVANQGKDFRAAPIGAAMPFEYDNHYYLEKE